MLPETDDSSIPGEAMSGDSMNFRKAMPDHRDQQKWEFYYKHCTSNGDKDIFSHGQFDCTGPY
jgi:hypothetical protein